MFGAKFDSKKVALSDLLKSLDSGDMQLPDFQRGWVWDDDRIRSLLASISVAFPIGAITTLQTGGEAKFLPRPIEGSVPRNAEPEALLLDGQQRLTSLYQTLFSEEPVGTKTSTGKRVKRHYYIDMKLALSEAADRDEWIISVPEDRRVRRLRDIVLDVSTPEREYELDLFPVNQVFESSDWRTDYNEHWNFDKEKIQLFNQFERDVLKRFEQYALPVIELDKTTSREAVCLVFEKINTGGVTLSVFELVTAAFAAEGYRLRDNWDERERRIETTYAVLGDLQSDEFLQVVTLLHTMSRRAERSVGCRRADILNLSVADYERFAPDAERGFELAAQFLHGEKIFKSNDVPYRSQIVPLAAILAELGVDAESIDAKAKLRRWFWNGVLGEAYGGSTETTFARDLPEVTDWIRSARSEEPSTARDANFQASRLRTLRTRNSAAYKGIHALLMRDGCIDFLNGEPVEHATFFDHNIDIHHIFPRAWCENAGIAAADFNAIVNKTALSARTNRRLGGRAPSAYLCTVRREAGSDERVAQILESHRIDGQMLAADDFWGFYRNRAARLLEMISEAMGKNVTMDDADFAPEADVEEYDDGPVDYSAEAAS